MVRAGFAQVQAAIDFADLAGTLQYQPTDPQLHFVFAAVSASLTPTASAGGLGSAIERRTRDAVSLLPGSVLLRWPASTACSSGLVSRMLDPADPEWAIPVAQIAAERWSMAAPNGDAGATIEIGLAGVLCESEDGSLSAPASVQLRWPEAGVDLSLDAEFSRQDERLELSLVQEGRFGGAPQDFVARFGDFGLELAGYAHVALELQLSLTASAVNGVFAVVGFEDTCQPSCNASGCSGCGPLSRRVLLELTLQRAL
jgi:hypothetical protein